MGGLRNKVYYILTKPAVFHEASWIRSVSYEKDKDKDVYPDSRVSFLFKERALKPYSLRVLIVHGQAGDGKSHYIRNKIGGADVCTIPVHEAFTPFFAIKKLQKLDLSKKGNCLYFNFTASLSSYGRDAEDRDSSKLYKDEIIQYDFLMTEVFWFLFSLVGMGFVEDSKTGESFRVRGSSEWHLLIEVTSSKKDSSLTDFLQRVPLFKYIGYRRKILPTEPFDVDADVQLVCKYLKAYSETDKSGNLKINQLSVGDQPIEIAPSLDLPGKECGDLLDKYMPKHVKKRKVLQHLFVKYMKRRCRMLEKCPGFIYNQGGGEYYKDPVTGKKELEPSNTKQLGSTLMSAMLHEVADMCSPSIKSKWCFRTHQQLVYDFKSRNATFQFLSLDPLKLEVGDREKLEKINVRIPNPVELKKREVLDNYLSSALNVKMSDKQRLTAIDEERYVLTADYTMKMLNIHERRMCGVPVIIKGETGVGKTALVRMLSNLWNQSVNDLRRTAIERLIDLFSKRRSEIAKFSKEDVDAWFSVANALSKEMPPSEQDVRISCKSYDDIVKVLKSEDHSFLEVLEVDPLLNKLWSDALASPSSNGVSNLLLKLFAAKPLKTFYKLSVHAALTPNDIKEFMKEKIDLARNVQKRRRMAESLEASSTHATIVVFFDEINTSTCMGLFKEILVDRSLEGEFIPDNLFVVAACNPHRGSSTTISSSSERDDWILGSYYVRSLSPTLEFLCWDYGALDRQQETAYIQQKMIMDKGPLGLHIDRLSDLISASQEMIREFALSQLRRAGFPESQAAQRAKSCVSQRDIQRVFALACFFQQSYTDALKSPSRTSEVDPIRRALMVALGIVYYLRLDTTYREKFCERIDKREAGSGSTPFLEIFQTEMDLYVDKMHLPRGIAKTNALKENLFATVVCTACRIPLVIVGAPGSSKTLSFNLALTNIKGAESKKSFFSNTKRFPALDPHHYQCSRRSTSLEIENVFKRAISRQINHNRSKLPINCVVFMDEAGLPEECHESLKVLHYYLDDPEVSFVAITNQILDAAKSNRAINLFRPKTDLEDLKTLAKGCMQSDVKNPLPERQNVMKVIGKFCKAYRKLMEFAKFKNFFGLRDFVHFIGYLRRHRGSTIALSPQLVLNALERNFNGVCNVDFTYVAKLFLSEIDESIGQLEKRNIIEILKDSVQEKSLAQHGDDEGAEAEVRYKLIIDTSEDDSMARLLFQHGVLEKASTRIFSCSDFPNDDEMQEVHIISAIKHAALEGQTVILSQTDDINESFYDLFNQHFRRIDDPVRGRRYYANIAIGSHSKLCRVDPKFQCIVHMRQSEVAVTPPPFLNRFEKFLVSQEDLLNSSMQSLPLQLKKVVSLARFKAKDFEEAIGFKNLYGCKKQTVDSLFLELLPVPGNDRRSSAIKSLSAQISENTVLPESDDDEDEDFEAYEDVLERQWKEKFPSVMKFLEQFLANTFGFSFFPKSDHERRAFAEAVFSSAFHVLGSCDFTPVKRRLIHNVAIIGHWIAESLSTEAVDVSGADKLCYAFGLASVTQWIVHHVCSRLLQIATTEAVVASSHFLSRYFILQYLDHQGHFSLNELVARAFLTANGNPSKTVCFTRTSPTIQALPSSATGMPSESFENILSAGLDIVMFKLESIPTLEAFRSKLHAFLNSTSARLFLVVANMQVCSVRRINLIRMLAEENEGTSGKQIKKAFVLLLHYPPSMGCTKPCYPSLFLHGWDHVYLESVVRREKESPVDIGQWIRFAYVGEKEQGSFQTNFVDALVSLLPSTVQLALSRVVFGNHLLCTFNRKMSPSRRCDLLLQLLETVPSFCKVICSKFVRYWTNVFIRQQIAIAVDLLKESESAITIADKIQNRVKSLFYNYFAYVLYQLNSDYNLEILFDSNERSADVKDLFLKIFGVTPVPRLVEISVRNDTLDARQPHLRQNERRTFPFFSVIARAIDRQLDEILMELHKELNPVFEEDVETASYDAEGKKNKRSDAVLSEVERIAAERLFHCFGEFRQRPEVDGDGLVLAVAAFTAIKQNEYLWQCYLADFAQTKLNCRIGSPGSMVLSTWIGNLEDYDVSQRVVALHVVAKLRQKRIGQAVAALRPLEAMRELNPLSKSNLSILTSLNKPAEVKDERLYSYVIDTMFDNLTNMLNNSKDTNIGETFSQWCNVYQTLCSSLPDIGTFHFSKRGLRPKMQCIHGIFVLVRSLHFTHKAATEAGLLMAKGIVKTFPEGSTQSQLAGGISGIPLSSVIQYGLQSLYSTLGTEDSVKRSDSRFVENCSEAFVAGILSFYFPPLPPDSPLVCTLEDCEFLLLCANCQTSWILRKDTVTQRRLASLKGQSIPIGFVNFKVFQACLSEVLTATRESFDRRTRFNAQIRDMVNAFLARKRGSAEVRPYLPLCYPNKPDRHYEPLAILYFHCCVHQFIKEWGSASFSNLLLLLSMDGMNAATRDVCYIERQALLQLTISRFAELFDASRKDDYCQAVTESAVKEINAIFSDKTWGGGENGGHVLSFLHHLHKQLHCSRQLMKLFTDDFKAKCLSFPWMKTIGKSLEKRPEIWLSIFPFMIPGHGNLNSHAAVHKKLIPLVTDIASRPTGRLEAIRRLEHFCREQIEAKAARKCQLRMSLWLHVYYQFYEKKIASKEFATALLQSFDSLDFALGQREIIACFVDPERMVRIEETPSLNPGKEHNTNQMRNKFNQRPKEMYDTIWKLFDPLETNAQDVSDVDLRRALSLLVAVSLGLPQEKTHLWSHLLHPETIENTFVCGNMYKNVVQRDGLLLDCGCEFTPDGGYGRADYVDYARMGTLNLHSRYLLLWMSFGAFSISLLTQPKATGIIEGRVISDWKSVGHYCTNQVKAMWLFLREKLKFSNEERAFFVTSALYKFLEVGRKSESGLSNTVFNTRAEVDEYERTFHWEVCQPVLSQFEDKRYLDEKIWQRHTLFSAIREFGSIYPVDASCEDLEHALDCLEGKNMAEELSILLKFFSEKQRLRVGGLLLPDLIEFYQWLHGELSHLVTQKEATKLKIGHVVTRLTGRYSSKYAEYVRRLFERVKEKYNQYVKLIKGAIGFGACAQVRCENDLHAISDDSILGTLLSDSDEGIGPDALFVVISDLVRNHNDFAEFVVRSSTSTSHTLCKNLSQIHPLEVVYYNCLLGDLSASELSKYLRNQDGGVPEEAGTELLKLIQSHHLYVPSATLIAQYDVRAMFDFERLQQAVVEKFIAGKPRIEEPTCIRKIFRYRSEVRFDDQSESSTALEAYIGIGLFPQKDQLPEDFQMEIPRAKKKRMEIAFHSLKYQGIVDVLKALRTITGYMSQIKVVETPTKFLEKCRTMKDSLIGNFLGQKYGSSGSEEVLSKIGLGTLDDFAQKQELLQMPLTYLYNAVDFFVRKLVDGEYESHSAQELDQRDVVSGKDDSEEDDDDDFDAYNCVLEGEWKAKHLAVIECLEEFLARRLEFSFIFKGNEEKEALAEAVFSSVFNVLGNCDFTPVKRRLIDDPTLIGTWVAESLSNSGVEMADVLATDKLCQAFALVSVTQWIIHHVCSRLLQIATPEGIIMSRRFLPQYFLLQYLDRQGHFSLKELVARSFSASDRNLSKTVCFTRTSLAIQALHSSSAAMPSDGFENILPAGLDVIMCKLESVLTLEAFQSKLHAFFNGASARLFLVVANMRICSIQRINLIRMLAEENEGVADKQSGKAFVLLLHYPPSMGCTRPCYPSLFLHGWDHVYLEHIVRTEKGSPVDIGRWIRVACIGKNDSCVKFQSSFIDALVSFLPSTVQLALSRVVFGDHSSCVFNRKMNPSDRCDLLLQLLNTRPLFCKIICLKFARYWTNDFIQEQLTIAVDSLKESESALTITDTIQNRLKSLLYNFFAYVLYQLNNDYNLEILFDSSEPSADVKDLFLEIFSVTPVPRLVEVSVRNDTFDARQPHLQLNQRPVFPFFSAIARSIERRLDEILLEIQKNLNPVFDNDIENVTEAAKAKKKEKADTEQLSKIEQIAAERLFRSLQDTSHRNAKDNDDMVLAVTAFAAMKQNGYLWQCYLTEFAQTKLNCNVGSPDSMENIVLSTWIGDLERCDVSQRIVNLHVVARLRQKSIGLAVAALRPLEKMRDLNQRFKSDLSFYESSLLTISSKPAEVKDERLYSYVIIVMLDNLSNMLKKEKDEDINESFSQWCNVYQNLGSSLPDIGTFHFSEKSLRPQLQRIHAIFVLVKSLHFTQRAIEAGLNMAREIVSTAPAQEASMSESQRTSDVASVPLISIIKSGLQHLKRALGAEGTVQHSDALSIAKRSDAFVSDILSFYFPSLPPNSLLVCSLNDCETLLHVANSQTPWLLERDPTVGPRIRRSASVEECVEKSQSIPIGLINFKTIQACLSGILKSTYPVDSGTHFSLQIRSMVNAVLARKRNSAEVRPYIPLCYPNSQDEQYEPLAVVYFHCCLHQFSMKQGRASFSNLLQLLSMDGLDASVKDVLYIERQALLQLAISRFAELFDPARYEDYRQAITTSTVIEINNVFNDESWGGGERGGHRLSFLHHLHKQLHCSRQVIKLFTNEYQAKCEPFPWMSSIKKLLEKPPEIQGNLFPFIIPGHDDSAVHRKLIADISKSSPTDCPDAIERLEHFCQEQIETQSATRFQLRMSMWLHIYYLFYESKIKSNDFAEALLVSFDSLDFSSGQRELLACFVDPERMTRETESPSSINPDEERRKRDERPKEMYDAIWKLFNPLEIKTQDASDTDLRRTLSLLVAVSFGLPPERTHLWSHLLHPEMIEQTFVCGNMYECAVKPEELLFDCGCEFTSDGDYGRADYVNYARRGALNLHSRYLLLWMSFGALTMSLLTQPKAKGIIKGRVISDWQSPRHYCTNQVKTMWVFLRENLKFSDEERTFFVSSALYKFLEVASKPQSGLSNVVFNSRDEVEEYERTFHEQVFQPVLSQFEDKKYLDDKIWQQHELLSSVREFGTTYPVDASYKDFVRTLDYVEGAAGKHVTKELSVLLTFFTEKQRLRVGGLLLPDLIEFYQWLHGELSHLVTQEEARKLKIGHVVKRLTGRYSREYAQYVRRLFERVKEKYNKYVELIRGTIGFGSHSRVHRDYLHTIGDDSILGTLLSDSDEGGGSDALFVVICELVRNHNEFLEFVVRSCSSGLAANLLPLNPSRIHPLEVAYYNCLLGDMSANELTLYLRNQDGGVPEEAGSELLRLIQSYHLYVPGADCTTVEGSDMTSSLIAQHDFRTSPMFNFRRLQEVVAEAFIAGKPFIQEPKCIRKIFRYRSKVGSDDQSDLLKSTAGLEAHIGLFPQKDQLPEDYQMEIPKDKKKRMETAFHSLNYQGTVDVLKALRTITGHLSQMKVEETPSKFLEECRAMKDNPIGDFLRRMYGSSKSEDVLSKFEFATLDDLAQKLLLELPLFYLYNAVDFFAQKLLNKEYDFAHLPIFLKTPLPDDGAQAIRNLPDGYIENGLRGEVLRELKRFEEVLLHAEVEMAHEPQQALKDYLIAKRFYSSTDLPASSLPDTIRVEHYMGVRIILRRVINEVRSHGSGMVTFEERKNSQPWTEIVMDLWKEFPTLKPDFGTDATEQFHLPPIDLVTGMFPHSSEQLWYQGGQETDSTDYDTDDDKDGSEHEALSDEDSPANQTTIQPFIESHDEDLSLVDEDEEKLSGNGEEEEYKLTPAAMVESLPKTGALGTSDIQVKSAKEKVKKKITEEESSVVAAELTIMASESADLEAASKEIQASSKETLPAGKSMMESLSDMSRWTVDDVSSFLDEMELGKHKETFKSSKIKGSLLIHLDHDTLKELEVTSGLDRCRILERIEEAKKSSAEK